MVERCPDKTEVDGPIPSTLTESGSLFSFSNSLPFKRQRGWSDSIHTHQAFWPILFMNDTDIKQAWWKPGAVLFVQMSGWIAVPVIIALYVGKYFDDKYDTEPWIFIITIALAFIVSMIGISKIAVRYVRKIEEESKNKKKNTIDTTYDTRNNTQ